MVADLTVLAGATKRKVLIIYKKSTLDPIAIAFELGKEIKNKERSIHIDLVKTIKFVPIPAKTVESKYQDKCVELWSKTYTDKDFLAQTHTRYSGKTLGEVTDFLKDVAQGKIEAANSDKLVKKITKMPDPELEYKGKSWVLK